MPKLDQHHAETHAHANVERSSLHSAQCALRIGSAKAKNLAWNGGGFTGKGGQLWTSALIVNRIIPISPKKIQ